MTVSHSNVSKASLIGTGRRRPDLSGSPSSIFWTMSAVTFPLSSTLISVGLISQLKWIPSSLAWRSSSIRQGASASVRR